MQMAEANLLKNIINLSSHHYPGKKDGRFCNLRIRSSWMLQRWERRFFPYFLNENKDFLEWEDRWAVLA
jgi:hypothetical protein